MNERIQQLAEQAGIYKLNLSDETEYWIMEKFAELIVRECANKVDSNLRDWLHDNSGTMGDKILEHFGVEE